MDGKLDYKEGTVLMNHPANSVYQQVRNRSPIPEYFRKRHITNRESLRSSSELKEAFSAHRC